MLNLRNNVFLVSLLGLFFVSNKITAQDEIWASVIRAGYNNSNIKVKLANLQNTSTTPKHGYYINLGTERRFSDRMSFILGGEYQKANSYLKSSTSPIEGKLSIGYLSGNLDFKFYPIYDLGIYTGGFITFPLSYEFTGHTSDNSLSSSQIQKQNDQINQEIKSIINFDVGLRFGADYRIFKQLHIEAYYRLGLSNSTIKSKDNIPREIKVSSINVGLNYRFGFRTR